MNFSVNSLTINASPVQSMERSRGHRTDASALERLMTCIQKKKSKLNRQVGDLNVKAVLGNKQGFPAPRSLIVEKEQLLTHLETVYTREHGGTLLEALVKRQRVS